MKCRSDLGRFGNLPKVVPILSLAVAIVAMLPNVILALSRALHQPTTKIELLDVRMNGAAPKITLINLGDATGVVQAWIECNAATTERSFSPRLIFQSDQNAPLLPNQTSVLRFDKDIYVEFPNSGSSYRSLLDGAESDLRIQIIGAARDYLKGTFTYPDPLAFTCKINTAGLGGSPKSPGFNLSLDALGGSQVSYGFDLNPGNSGFP